MTSTKPNYLPKASLPYTITLGAKASIYELGGEHRYLVYNSTIILLKAFISKSSDFSAKKLSKALAVSERPW